MARKTQTALAESSDDEGEPSVTTVSDYKFEDENDLPVSFSVLPLKPVGNSTFQREISLYGKVDNGLQKMSKQVVAWNYDLSASVSSASISVLSKDGKWIVLGGKPLKWYGSGEARTILVTLAALHFIRRIPEVSHKGLWDHLAKSFSSFEVKPNPNDLISHIDLIADAVKSDSFLCKSELLRSFLEDPEKIANYIDPKVASKFIVVDDTVDYSYEDDSDENDDIGEAELYDSVCAFCDNGGFVLCCDGVCMRAFHATGEAESQCEGVGLSKRKVDAKKTYICDNCKHKIHQCFCCGKLGVSDKSKCPEVFRCSNAFCGHFYHPQCIAEVLKPEDESEREQLKKSISEGGSFICTIHKCAVCGEGEKKSEIDLQFAVCRRCPTAYHRKCLPREIRFAKTEEEQNDEESDEEEDDGIVDRAWENLLPNRVLIYCLKHEIIEGLGTPARGHVVFPDVADSKGKNVRKRYTETEGNFQRKRPKVSGKSPSPLKKSKVSETQGSSGSLRKHVNVDKTPVTRGKSLPRKTRKPSSLATQKPIESNKSVDYGTRKRKSEHLVKSHDSNDGNTPDKISESQTHISDNFLTEESKRRVMSVMDRSEFEVTLDDVLTKRQIPSVYSHSSKNMIDKVVTLGKVEGAVEAVRAAVNKLKNGSTVDEAKGVCGPEVLNQMFKWQSKLKVYLAPVLHGSRYTSYGRHFTKVEKLEEIANILHSYVRNGDMIVDFCCGANDFSCIMRKKLEETGKKCLYKNYDVILPKNSFNFEKRDWMTIEPHELIDGGKLIIGLNPPFGVKAALANNFINKALQFKPKLLILIVPHECEGPNQKTPPYDVVWENNAFCSGKSFYLPGSVDGKDTQLDQWNVNTPSLVLWSRRDWTPMHTSIAKIHSHSQQNANGADNNQMEVVNVDDEDLFVEKTTDVVRTDQKVTPAPAQSDDAKPPARVSVPRGTVNPVRHVPFVRRDAGVNKVEDDDRARQSYYTPPAPQPNRMMPRGMSIERGFSPMDPRPYPNEYGPTSTWSERGAGFRQRFGSFQQNPTATTTATATGVPLPMPYPNVVADAAPGFEHKRRMSATERYAPQLNDLSYTVGVGRYGPAHRGRGLHFRQPQDHQSIPYPHPFRPPGSPATWHNHMMPYN